jgi:asparagine synthase (glutamine-hydrolysing)
MCGFTGIYDPSQQASNLGECVRRMTETLAHRGPDAEGIYSSNGIALGHRRLSIIDLSSAGHQPMKSPDGKIAIAFNGEVYNFQELRAELEHDGMTFQSRTDTEVVLCAYIKWGLESFRMLNGMFAFAIWDSRTSEVHLVRDRFGIKPLYYYSSTSNQIVFGSEIKALLASGLPVREISWAGLNEYMWFGNALGQNTLFSGIKKLLPGHYLTVGAAGSSLFRYWALEDVKPLKPTLGEATAEVARLLENSVKSQLVGDVPVGVFLSGGIDSSAITAFATKHYANKLQTFSVGFDFDRGVNELPAARFVADYYGTEHHEIKVSGSGMEDVIIRLVNAHDEPFADAANIPLYLLCEQIRGNVKVVLQGDGGDELFAGYRRYNILAHSTFWRLASRLLLSLGVGHQRGARFLNAVSQSDPAMRMALLLTVDSLQDPPTRIMSEQWRRHLAEHDPFLRYKELDQRFSCLDPVQKMLYTDMSVVLPDTFFEKVDKSTMAQGIEVRVPFLDANLASYAIGLPSDLKVRGFQKKWILRRALRGVVPDRILDGKKTGFGVPYEYWLRGPLSQFMKSVLLDPRISSLGMFDKIEIERAISQHISGERNNGFLLWKALNLALWAEQYGITGFSADKRGLF